MKKPLKVMASVGVALSIFATSFVPQADASTVKNGYIEVKADSLYLRNDDNFSSKIVRVLKKGEVYKVYGESNGMYDLGANQWTTANSKYVSYSEAANVSSASAYATSVGTLTVKVDVLNVRNDANLSSPIVKKVKKGQSYIVYGKKNGWYNIGGNQWVSGNTSYVSYTEKATNAVASVTNKKVVIKASSLNIRNQADFNSKIVGVVKSGQTFTVYETKNGLYRIGDNQWISASSKYVSEAGSSNATPAVAVASNKADAIISLGKSFMGMKYVWASSNPANGGFDCSGFIYYLFKNNGYNISRLNVEGYWNMVQRISSPQVGDLVFFKNTYRTGPSHIGIYLGNGQFLNANSSKGIAIDNLNSSYWQNHFLGYGKFKQ